MVDVAGKPRASSSLHKTDMVRGPERQLPLAPVRKVQNRHLKVLSRRASSASEMLREHRFDSHVRLLKHGVLVLEAMELLGKRHDGGGVRRGQRDDLAL